MNKGQVLTILTAKLAEMATSAKEGKVRQGFISGTLIVMACSPGKFTVVYPDTMEYGFLDDYLAQQGHKPGRNDRKMGQRQMTKVIDEKQEQKFYDKTYINQDPDGRRGKN